MSVLVALQGGSPQTVSPGFINQSGVVFAPGFNQYVSPALIAQVGVTFAPQVNLAGAFPLISQVGVTFAPQVNLAGAFPLIAGAGVVFAPNVNLAGAFPLIAQVGVPFTPTLNLGAAFGLISQLGIVFAPSVAAAASSQTVLLPRIVGSFLVFSPTITGTPRRFAWLEARIDAPVVAEALMENLVTEYGENRGRHVYFALEREQKGPFAPGNKYDAAERPVQPVVVVQSHRPGPFFAPKPAANAPKAAEDTLRDFIKDATERTGIKKPPTVL